MRFCRGGDAFDDGAIVNGHGDIGAFRQFSQPPRFRRAHDVVGDLDIADSGISKDFGFADLLTCDARRARVQLSPSDIGDLVRLDVGPKVYAQLVAAHLHAPDIGFHQVHVDDDARSLQILHCLNAHAWSPLSFANHRCPELSLRLAPLQTPL